MLKKPTIKPIIIILVLGRMSLIEAIKGLRHNAV